MWSVTFEPFELACGLCVGNRVYVCETIRASLAVRFQHSLTLADLMVSVNCRTAGVAHKNPAVKSDTFCFSHRELTAMADLAAFDFC